MYIASKKGDKYSLFPRQRLNADSEQQGVYLVNIINAFFKAVHDAHIAGGGITERVAGCLQEFVKLRAVKP